MHPWFTAAELIPTLTTKPLATESAGEHTRGLATRPSFAFALRCPFPPRCRRFEPLLAVPGVGVPETGPKRLKTAICGHPFTHR